MSTAIIIQQRLNSIEATLKARDFAKDKWNGTDIYELTGKQDAVYKGDFILAIKQAAGPNAAIMKSTRLATEIALGIAGDTTLIIRISDSLQKYQKTTEENNDKTHLS